MSYAFRLTTLIPKILAPVPPPDGSGGAGGGLQTENNLPVFHPEQEAEIFKKKMASRAPTHLKGWGTRELYATLMKVRAKTGSTSCWGWSLERRDSGRLSFVENGLSAE